MKRVDVVPWSIAPTSLGAIVADPDAFALRELDLTIALRADLFAEGVLCGVGAAGRLAGAAGRSAVDAACAAPCMRGAERSARSLMLTHQSFGCKIRHVSSRQRQMSAKSAHASGSNKA